MKQPIFYTAGCSEALSFARNQLQQWGYVVSPIPSEHITHLLLPIPSFENANILKGGSPLTDVLKTLPENITILGGHLPELPYHCIDFLKDEYYLTENAAITAQCALKLIQQKIPGILQDVPILVIGWGRIGKHLVRILRSLGANVTAAVRKERDLLALQTEQCNVVYLNQLIPKNYRIVINTAPAAVLNEKDCHSHALLMDLASQRGIEGNRVIWARGLPNKEAPQASGNLIAKTALRYALGKE